MDRLLVISVYRQGTFSLYQWQSWYLKRTTRNYDHLLICSEQPPFPCFWQRCRTCQGTGADRHRLGILAGLRYLRNQAPNYSHALLLDSDAFPVKADWREVLDSALAATGRSYAAPVRTEHYDLFPHVSFVYAQTATFLLLGDRMARIAEHPCLRGGTRRDLGTKLPLEICFALLKSNVYSPHPLLHNVYGDLVYHCGAGSRKLLLDKPAGEVYRTHDCWNLLSQNYRLIPSHKPTPAFINRLVGENRFTEDADGGEHS